MVVNEELQVLEEFHQLVVVVELYIVQMDLQVDLVVVVEQALEQEILLQ